MYNKYYYFLVVLTSFTSHMRNFMMSQRHSYGAPVYCPLFDVILMFLMPRLQEDYYTKSRERHSQQGREHIQ